MLTDEVKIKVFAGRGGDGVVAFNKTKMSLGPTGGTGGKGGNVYFQGVSNLSALNKYKNKPKHYAGNGKNGQTDNSDGRTGEDIILTVPIGSVLHNLTTGEDINVKTVGEPILVATGGFGGRGNFCFRSPVNTSPEEREEGRPGQEFEFMLELRLIADIGLVGLPNIGKSSLLNELTKADVKVANYEFTTLEPNLGALEGIIIADIPGLIEGASQGKGLGIKFLKHIKRTTALAHCISLESENPKRDYDIIRKELGDFDPELLQKKEIILLTKSDLMAKNEIDAKIKEVVKINPAVEVISIHDWDSLQNIRKVFLELAKPL
ncbi:MAG: GTPase obg [Candidatus Moranbacteria bacterium GW2011_GWA2_39_41]|nr:MAG: GTPase obg [Candidatus Moranbacteria bacterium GW2011_GWA2_39_41]